MKHRGRPAACLKRTPRITVTGATLLGLAWLANTVALATGSTGPAAFALVVAGVAMMLLLVFQP